jgi:conjugative relaxase-like TrwC/TraI family protein
MLSIGAMGGGQGAYYLSLTQESYYQNEREPQGQWYGKGAEALGLTGTIRSEEFLHVFQGIHPQTQEKLVQNVGKEDRQLGWDLTFSAPKSVSVLWAIGDAETKKEIEEAHREAVKTALDYLSKEACFTRRGQGGKTIEGVSPVIATFQHGTSRANDMQLHSHTLVLNIGVREDKTTGSILSKPLYEMKMVLGAIYRADLSSKIEERGYQIERDGDSFAIVGVSKSVTEHFSKRRAEVEKIMSEKGLQGAKAASVATLSTREKKSDIGYNELFPKWQSEAKALGLTAETIRGLKITFDREESQKKIPLAMTEVRKEMESKESFRRSDLVESIARHGTGQGISGSLAVRSADFLESQGKIEAVATVGHENTIRQKNTTGREKLYRIKEQVVETLKEQAEITKDKGYHHLTQIGRTARGRHTWNFHEPTEGWRHDALRNFKLSNTTAGLNQYEERGQVIEASNKETAKAKLILTWKTMWTREGGDLKNHLIIAETHLQVKDLNRRAQGERAKAKLLGLRRIKTKGNEIIREKDRVLYAGQLGTVKRIELLSEKMLLSLDSGKDITINYKKASNLKLGYAVTGSVSRRIPSKQVYALGGFYYNFYIQTGKAEKNTLFFMEKNNGTYDFDNSYKVQRNLTDEYKIKESNPAEMQKLKERVEEERKRETEQQKPKELELQKQQENEKERGRR